MSKVNNCQGNRRSPEIATSACSLLAMTGLIVMTSAAKESQRLPKAFFFRQSQIPQPLSHITSFLSCSLKWNPLVYLCKFALIKIL